MDFVETLDSLMPSYSLVELFAVKNSKYQLLVKFLKKNAPENRKYAIIGNYEKRKMDEELNMTLSLTHLKKDFNLLLKTTLIIKTQKNYSMV